MTKVKMALALDKLIRDVKEEKVLWNENHPQSADEQESAWNRVASKNMLTGGEAKSIFKVLCKKYRQESLKPFSSWQLFESLRFIDEKNEEVANKTDTNNQTGTSPTSNHEEETFVELLEVKDEDFSDDETTTTALSQAKKDIKEDVKPNITLLNSDTASKALIKNILEKHQNKEHDSQNHHNNSNDRNHHNSSLNLNLTNKKEKDSTYSNALKRKYSSIDNQNGHSKSSLSSSDADTTQHEFQEKRRLIKTSVSSSVLTSQQQQLKSHQQQSQQQQQIQQDVTVAVPKDIAEAVAILNNSKTSGNINSNNNSTMEQTNENDENLKYNSFGNYVAQTMSRLTPKLAAKLEIKILQSIIDVNSEMMNHY